MFPLSDTGKLPVEGKIHLDLKKKIKQKITSSQTRGRKRSMRGKNKEQKKNRLFFFNTVNKGLKLRDKC